MAAAPGAAAIQRRPVAVEEEAAAIAAVAAVAKAAAAVPVVAVAVPKGNAEPGLVSPSARCTSVAIRGTEQRWPREVRRMSPIRQSRFWPRTYPQLKSQEELSETYVATSRKAIARSSGRRSAVSGRLDLALSLLSFRFPCAGGE